MNLNNKNKEIHIWNCLDNAPYILRVYLSKNFKEKLLDKLPENKTEVIRKLNSSSYSKNSQFRISRARFFNWFKYNDLSMPLWVAMGFCEIANILLEEMEKSIISYKQKTLNNVCVKNPILPIKFNPVFVSFASHFCFDGSLPKDGKGSYYSQKNRIQIENFIQKARHCFGNLSINISKDGKNIPKIRLPRFIGEICQYLCKFDSFGTFDCEIPKFLLNLDKDYKLTILISAIVDEGGVMTEYIYIGLSNERLIKNLWSICKELEYDCSDIKQTPKLYYFYIKSIKKFYDDYKKLNEKHNLVSLTFKEEAVKDILRFNSFPNSKPTVEEAQIKRNKVIEILKEPKTTRELALQLSAKPRTMRRYILRLLKESKIKREKRGKYFYYYVPNFSKASLNSL